LALGSGPVGLIAGASREEHRSERFFMLAIVLSLLVHLLAALLWIFAVPRLAKLRVVPAPAPTEQFVTISSAIQIEKRAVPRPQNPARPPAPAPKPVPRQMPQKAEPPAWYHRELTSPKLAAQPAPPESTPLERPTPHPARVRSTPVPRRVAQVNPGESSQESKRSPLTQKKIDELEQEFSRTIAQVRSESNPLRVPQEAPAAPKHYTTQMVGVDGRLTGFQGMCDPVKSWEADGWDYYFVACNVAFDDGRVERQGVPWPVRFRPEADPFTGTGTRSVPLAPPLPGWRLGPGEVIAPELRRYLHDRGVDL
jgi:hypothetical protein